MSRQFGPTPISTSSGTLSGCTFSICSRDQLLHRVHFLLRNFKHQFVMDLQQHARPQFALAHLGVDADHGQLDQVGGGALQRGVDRGALGEAAQVGVLAVDVGNGTHAAEQRRHFLSRRACSSVRSMNSRTPLYFSK